jgi:HSP20 family molecular chaperone IbpA
MYTKLTATSPLYNTLRAYENLLKTASQADVTANTKGRDIVEYFNFAGYDPAGLTITVKDRIVSVAMSKDGKVISREDFNVDKGYDLDNIKADYKFGLLTLTIPTQTPKEAPKPRSVSVNVVA